jgi:hypothetical protein
VPPAPLRPLRHGGLADATLAHHHHQAPAGRGDLVDQRAEPWKIDRGGRPDGDGVGNGRPDIGGVVEQATQRRDADEVEPLEFDQLGG